MEKDNETKELIRRAVGNMDYNKFKEEKDVQDNE